MPCRNALPHLPGALLLAAGLAAIGCTDVAAPIPPAPVAAIVAGNWQIASSAPAAASLPVLSGAISGTSTAITGIFHADSAGACVARTTPVPVTGRANPLSAVTLTGAGFAGGTLTIAGTLAADGKSLTGASYNVTGGTCAFSAVAPAIMQSYTSIDGSYTGSFSDSDGQVIAVNATLSQSPSSDTTGNFDLSGSGSFPNNPCFVSPVSISSSQVTGGSFSLTYADQTTMNSVAVTGTFSTDGKTLTVTNWTLTGPCGPDSGTGTLTRP